MAKKEEGISEKAVHTKGPWKFEFDGDGDHAIFAGTKLIAVTVGLDHFSREEDEANAAVLAASPELLEVLESVLPNLEWANIHGSRCEEHLTQVKYVIRKARGEQL